MSALQVCLVCQNAFADARETGARLPSAPRKASRALPLPALFASATILMPVSADTDGTRGGGSAACRRGSHTHLQVHASFIWPNCAAICQPPTLSRPFPRFFSSPTLHHRLHRRVDRHVPRVLRAAHAQERLLLACRRCALTAALCCWATTAALIDRGAAAAVSHSSYWFLRARCSRRV